MNKLLMFLYILFIPILVMSCNSGVGTEPIITPEPTPTETIYKLTADLSIDKTSTNYYNEETYSLKSINSGGRLVNGGVSTQADEGDDLVDGVLPTSPVEIRFGDEIYSLEDLKAGIEFTNNSYVKVLVNVNSGYNIFIGGPFETPTQGQKSVMLNFYITNNMGLVINVTNKNITSVKLKAKKYGRGSLYVSGTEINDLEEHSFIFPNNHMAKLSSFPPAESGIIYSYIMYDGITTTTNHYPLSREEYLKMDNDKSVIFRYGRENLPWDGISVEEPIFVDNVHEIYNAYELYSVALKVNNEAKNFANETVKLIEDIDLNSKNFIGIGRKQTFSGIFEGNGKVVRNLRILPYDSIASGFIGNMNGGGISNLTVYGSVESVKGDVGGIIGFATKSTVLNVTNYVYVVGSKTSLSTGGIVGSFSGGAITNSVNFGIVSGGSNVGGIAGRFTSGGAIALSYSTTNIKGDYYVGGIVGNASGASVFSSYNSGYVYATGSYAGGISGYNDNGNTASSYNTGDIEGLDYVGGIEGYRSVSGVLNAVYSIGIIRARSDSTNVGGIVGCSMKKGSSGGDFSGVYFLKTDSINKDLLIVPGQSTFDVQSGGSRDAIGMGDLGYSAGNAWATKVFTESINGVTTRHVLVGLGEGI